MKTNKQDPSKWPGRFGTALGVLVTLAFLFSAITKLAHVSKMVDELTHAGIPEGAIVPIGILELTCLTLYWLPRTSILGTVLLTGYMGGAIVTHIIGRESFVPPLIVGIWMFMSAYLRHAELRKLIPLRSTETEGTYEASLNSQAVRG
jgi:hypothetical protein